MLKVRWPRIYYKAEHFQEKKKNSEEYVEIEQTEQTGREQKENQEQESIREVKNHEEQSNSN